MLESLSKTFKDARLKLQGKKEISEEDIKAISRDVRRSLIGADVELGVARTFVKIVQERIVGSIVHTKVKDKSGKLHADPAQHFIRICHEELVNLMGPVDTSINYQTPKGGPALIMMVGLQGAGKTTTTGKLAQKLLNEGKKPMLVAADIYRPAAIQQLQTLGRQLGVPVFTRPDTNPVDLCIQSIQDAKSKGCNVVIFDTAGRLAMDENLMQELIDIKTKTDPQNIFFVCDAMIGQSSVTTAAEFDKKLEFSGFILTKLDGDARGGAALSIKSITGKPIKFLGMGEKLDALEEFRPEGLADRILGYGDIVGLMQDFERVADKKDAEKDAKKMLEGNFSFEDFLKQIKMIQKMGSLKDIFAKIPGMGNLMEMIPKEALDDRELKKVEAMIQSMTRQERRNPDVFNDSRLKRVAKGSGRSFEEVKALFERFLETRKMMGNLGQSGMMQSMMSGNMPDMSQMMGGMGGGMPDMSQMMGGMGGGNPMGGLGQMFGQKPPQKTAKNKFDKTKRFAEARRRQAEQKKARKKNRKK
jgi:signal recognition particle subunit SRP54